MGEPLRAGIIGCGGVSERHAISYQQCEDTALVAAVDLSPEALQAFVKRHGPLATYTSHTEMLQQARLDIVSVCTPPVAHLNVAVDAAGAGVKAIWLEKPMALDLRGADTILNACESGGVRLAVGHQLRYAARYRTAKGLIESGAVGTVERLWGVCHGSPLQTNATHTIDLLRYLMGDRPIEWVMGAVDISEVRCYEGIWQEEAGVGLLQFAHGPVALIESGGLNPSRGYHHIYVDGVDGQIELSREGAAPIRLRSRSTGGEWQEPPEEEDVNPVSDIVAAIRTGTEICSSGLQGRQTLEAILALFESARTHSRVPLPLPNPENPLDHLIEERAQGRRSSQAAAPTSSCSAGAEPQPPASRQ